MKIAAPLNVTVDVLARTCVAAGYTCAVNRLEVYKTVSQVRADNEKRLALEKYCGPYTPTPPSMGSEVGIVSVHIQEKSPQGVPITSHIRYRQMSDHWRSLYSRGAPITSSTPKGKIPLSSVSTVAEQIQFADRGLTVWVTTKQCFMQNGASCTIDYVHKLPPPQERTEASLRAKYAQDCPKK